MAWPQRDLMVLLSGPIILLIRFFICTSGSAIQELPICSLKALSAALNTLQPWMAFYALQPKDRSEVAVLTLLLFCLLLFLLLLFVWLKLLPSPPMIYIQPAQGLHEFSLRIISMFMRSAYAVAYIWAYYSEYTTDESQHEAHKLAMHAICSHYIIRGVEALLLRRYSAPFFPPQLSHPLPVITGVGVYLYHYVLIYAHFKWMTFGTDWHDVMIKHNVNTQWMYIGYAIAVFGQVMMLKQADEIPGNGLFKGYVWKGEVISWIGIGFISQHPGVWILALSVIPFSCLEDLVEMWTGQRYARLCTALRSTNAVLFKDVPELAEEVGPEIASAAANYGTVSVCMVRPRSTRETSDLYVVFDDALDAGMAASSLDGKTIGGWRANALQRKY